jgi:predicted dehydrogenase
MAKINVGVIGVGSIGNAHLQGFEMVSDKVNIQALCDVNPVRLKEMGKAWNVAPEHLYTDRAEMLKNEKLDAVTIGTPNLYHAEVALDTIKQGIATMIEKPMVVDMKQAAAVKRAQEKSQAKVMVAFSHRFNPLNIAAKKLLKKGVIGKPYMIRVRFAHGGPYPGWAQSDWFYKKDIAIGGASLDMGIHAIDICQYHIGPIKSVAAEVRTLRKKIEVDDNTVMVLDFGKEAACLGYIEVGWTSCAGFSGTEIMGDKGCMLIDMENGLSVTTGTTTPDGTRKLKTEKVDVDMSASHWAHQIREFVNFAMGKKTGTGIPGIEEGISSLKVGLGAMESSKTGKRVVIK